MNGPVSGSQGNAGAKRCYKYLLGKADLINGLTAIEGGLPHSRERAGRFALIDAIRGAFHISFHSYIKEYFVSPNKLTGSSQNAF